MDNVDIKGKEVREKMDEILELMRKEQELVGRSPRGRAIAVAITELEKASMAMVESFYADTPYKAVGR